MLTLTWLSAVGVDQARAEPATAKTPDPLPPLPEVPRLDLGEPAATDLKEFDALLERIVSLDSMVRDEAIREILEVRPHWLAAISHRLRMLADAADRDAMKSTLLRIRGKARDEVRARMRDAGQKGQVETPDYLKMLSDHAEPKSKAWVDVTSISAMSRMLVQIANIQAARLLIDIYVRFGEFLRVDTQLALSKLGDTGVAALIEAQMHPAEKIGRWARRQLDTLGKAIPAEAIQTTDHEGLADILRAYGRIRDPAAARLTISFCNTERAQVRQAARQSVALMGEVALWQLRDTYENTIGKRPPRDWSWQRTARELFKEFDQLRLAQVYRVFEQGRAAASRGDLKQMRDAFDKVLAQNPLFEKQSEMAAGYFDYASKFADEDRAGAIAALRRALRIDGDDARRQRAESLLYTLEAEELISRGIADQVLLRRALELDPGNERAKQTLESAARGEQKKQREIGRYAAAAVILLASLLAIGFIALFRGGERKNGKGARPPTPQRESTVEHTTENSN